jgi:hypothetical protein
MENKTLEDEIFLQKLNIVMKQTTYSREESKEKLIAHNLNHISVIQEFMGIAKKNAPKIRSVNQAIYSELRHQLDSSIKGYNDKKHEELQKEFNK